MTENQTNIWKSITTDPKLGYRKFKHYPAKKIEIRQVGKEKIISKEDNDIKNDSNKNHKKNIHFLNKKKGRKIKGLIEITNKGAHDRNSDDNLKRKVKTHFHNYILALLNKKIKTVNPNEKIKFGKINSKITQDITVRYNLILFDKKIMEIIKDASEKYQNKNINIECINYIMKNSHLYQDVIKYLNLTYKDLYINYYLKSTKKDFIGEEKDESYEAHKEKLRKKYGEEYVNNYMKNAEKLISFFSTCKQRKSKKKNNNKLNDISSDKELEDLDKNNVYNFINDGNIDNKNILNENYNNNMVSTITQTDNVYSEDDSESENEN